MQPNQGLAQLTAEILLHLEPVLQDLRPDWILVQGDTTTVVAAALLGFYNRIRVGHVEAGLRTNDRWQPFPEEINRRIAGVVADLHFAPTEHSRRNLLAENIPAEAIIVTGNPAIDALRHITGLPCPPETERLLEQMGVGLTPAGGSLCWSRLTAVKILASRWKISATPCARWPRATRSDWRCSTPCTSTPTCRSRCSRLLGGVPNITLTPPQDYLPMAHLLQRAHLVLTDSGGIQEEATSLGKPTLVLREVTERPEGVEAGVLKLVGTDTRAS